MTERNQQMQGQWTEMFSRMNETMAQTMEQNMEVQSAFADSWADAMEESMPQEEAMTEGLEGMARAYDVWIDGAEQLFERTTDAAEGEAVGIDEMRDIWLQSANEAFKQVMSTSAFAAGNGQMFESLMELQGQGQEVSRETLSQLGMASADDVEEVAKRLIELERRQHSVEEKLDRVLTAVEK
jgi:hypothetical protein